MPLTVRLAVTWAVNIGALWVANAMFDGVHIHGWTAYLIGAGVLGVANAIIKPVVAILTLPLIILTLGVFALVINGLMLWLTSSLSEVLGLGFHVRGFWAAFFGALVVSIVSTVLSVAIRDAARDHD